MISVFDMYPSSWLEQSLTPKAGPPAGKNDGPLPFFEAVLKLLFDVPFDLLVIRAD
jgi:hypothetical protein